MDYNIIKGLKKSQANISLFKLDKLPSKREFIVKTFASVP